MAQPVGNLEDPAVSRFPQTVPVVDQVLVGTFTADDRYDIWRPAGTEDWLLLNTVAGAGRVGVAGSTDVITEPGAVVIIRPTVPHDYGTAPVGGGAGSWSLQFV